MGARVHLHRSFWIPAITLTAISAATLLHATPRQQHDPDEITVTVTVTSRGKEAPPPISGGDIVVRQAGKPRPVISWEPAQTSARALDLVVLIDDALPANVATRWDEFEKFLSSLPANAHVGIAYGNRGEIQFAQQPTLNHAQAAKAFRNPAALAMKDSAIYQSVETLSRAWPNNQNQRVILLLSSGYDVNEHAGPESTISLKGAVNEAQRRGIVVYSIYARPSLQSNLNPAELLFGQNNLIHLATATGGKAFIFGLGDQTPPSFQPYLQELLQLLGEQYLLTFQAQPANKPGFAPLEVSSKNNSVQLHFQESVFTPGPK
jgi:hypothetical protein